MGQNKNQTLICMCSKWLLDVPENIRNIEIVFPVRGHSFILTDRVFSNVEKEFKKCKVILNPTEYESIIGKISCVKKIGAACVVYDWKSEAT